MIRVFPRRTNATPDDDLAFTDGPPLWKIEGHDVMVSCTFTYDKPRSEYLADAWHRQGYSVQIGGPAYNDHGGDFVSGRFLKYGYTITSRGCNNRCWFCYVPRREGNIRELPIVDGWNVLDSNLLQCSEDHIRAVFVMLKQQNKKPALTGGLEARLFRDCHANYLAETKARFYFAYDTPDDYEPLTIASEICRKYDLTDREGKGHCAMCYVLIGYPRDTVSQAEFRLKQVLSLGFCPMAMLYRDDQGKRNSEWIHFQKLWARPASIYAMKGNL